MQRCIIHCGMPKTGSSSIQHTLCHAPSGVLPFQYVYVDKPNLTDLVGAVWHQNPAVFHTNRKLGLTPAQAQRKRDRLQQLLAEQINKVEGDGLISAEGFYFLSESGLRAFYDWVSSFVDSILVVGYVRPPKSFMESAFQQGLKGGNFASLNLERVFPQYRKRLEKFDLVFGRENVQFWKFDRESFRGGDVVEDFCTRLGFEIASEQLHHRNEGLSLGAVRLLFAYRKFGPGYGVGPKVVAENFQLTKRLSQLQGGSKLRFAPELIKPILKMYRSDIEWIEKRLGSSLHEDIPDTPDAVRSEEDLLRFDEEALRWLAEQLGPGHVRRLHSNMTPQEVAAWVHELRIKVAAERSKQGNINFSPETLGTNEMTVRELIRLAKIAAPELKNMNQKKVVTLLREVFKVIAARIEAADEGELVVDGLGRFLVGEAGGETDGKEDIVNRTVRKVRLRQDNPDSPGRSLFFSPGRP